jgi:hypothetical protein
MNGVDTRTHGELDTRARPLPTPTPSPEPDDAAPPSDRRNHEEAKGGETLLNTTNGVKEEASSAVGSNATSRRPSAHEEAIQSDTSEKIRPIKRPGDGRRKSSVSDHDKMLKLSPRQIHELTSEPASIPVRAATPIPEDELEDAAPLDDIDDQGNTKPRGPVLERAIEFNGIKHDLGKEHAPRGRELTQEKETLVIKAPSTELRNGRPIPLSRSITTPALVRRTTSRSRSRAHIHTKETEERRQSRHVPPPLDMQHKEGTSKGHERHRESRDVRDHVSPTIALPLPPMSMPTFLSLELSATRPSPLYIYRPATTEFPYESSEIKYERLLNFLRIPLKIEIILGFGAFACLDAWMHVLTILPLRFLLAIAILIKWWGSVIVKEFRDLWAFVYNGLPRLWQRRKHVDGPTPIATPAEEDPPSMSRKPSSSTVPSAALTARQDSRASTTFQFPDTKELKDLKARRSRNSRFRHRRTKSTPSTLQPGHKADILKGLLVIASCFVLMRFDASRMYHGIRGQSAIKLYVIYNVLEVCDRLLSAMGQDVLECLFSRETLDRNPDGRSKVLRPLGMFLLALVYTVAHATALFYQVITLNVAVNSYSNALLTLLMSNQFVEIKSTVFKKFEKENLFQITCADIVERFQLWLMLLIIAMRNVVEVGGLSIQSSETSWTAMFTGSANASTGTAFKASSIIPMSFTIFPKYIAQVLNPFLLVLGSEMFVDWLKHAYITKFNQYKPEVYSKFFDVLAKDYYSNVRAVFNSLISVCRID